VTKKKTLYDLRLPNGKKLGDATYADLDAAEQFYRKAAAEALRKSQVRKLLELFEGARGRPAKSPEELDAWLRSPEGEAALAYDQTPDGKIIPELR
jgi:hypothetical protein